MTSPTSRGLFERIEPFLESLHPNSAYRRKIKEICDEYYRQLSECEASNKAVERALENVDYKGTYADGVQLLKQQLANITADRDSWRDQCSERVKDWEEVRQQLAAAKQEIENRKVYEIAADNTIKSRNELIVEKEQQLAVVREEVEGLKAEKDLVIDLLANVFDRYENGDDCYEDPEECGGYLGKAIKLDDETYNACCDLLNRLRPVTAPLPEKNG
jgi:chromosome segregation ATPase